MHDCALELPLHWKLPCKRSLNDSTTQTLLEGSAGRMGISGIILKLIVCEVHLLVIPKPQAIPRWP